MTMQFIGMIHHRQTSEIRGFDPRDDTIGYGRELLPLTKQPIAQRATTQVAA